MQIARGDIYTAKVVSESEVSILDKIRPVVILWTTNSSDLIMVAPIVSKIPVKDASQYVYINHNYYGLPTESVVLVSQIATISKKHLSEKIARLSNNDFKKIRNSIVHFFPESSALENSKKELPMKVYKDLVISGNESDLEKLRTSLKVITTPQWTSEESDSPNFLVFRRNAQNNLQGSFLFLSIEKNFEVTNITPTEKSSLNYDEYNALIDDFYNTVIKPIIYDLRLNINVESSSPEISLEDYLSEEVATKLRIFSAAANKSTGSAHPLDQERWFDFITTSFNNKDIINSNFLIRWFIEVEGWSQEVAADLMVEYENGINLLQYYVENKFYE